MAGKYGQHLRDQMDSNDLLMMMDSVKPIENAPSYEVCSKVGFMDRRSPPFPFRSVALASYPGSGNTWLRHLFHVTTGVWTGSVYNAQEIFDDYPGEARDCNDHSVYGIKIHWRDAGTGNCYINFDQSVIILRNPYHSMLSEYNRRKGPALMTHASASLFDSQDWNEFFLRLLKNYVHFWKVWAEFCERSHCTMYSYYSLKTNTYDTMKSMITDLQLPTDRLGCLRNKTLIVGKFKRPKRKQQETEAIPQCKLTVEVQRQAKQIIDKFFSDLESSSSKDPKSFTFQLREFIHKEMTLDPVCCTALC